MGWEMRNRKRVYYRKERYRDEEGRSRVRSIYCGSGERGERAAREDRELRARGFPAVSRSWWDTQPAVPRWMR